MASLPTSAVKMPSRARYSSPDRTPHPVPHRPRLFPERRSGIRHRCRTSDSGSASPKPAACRHPVTGTSTHARSGTCSGSSRTASERNGVSEASCTGHPAVISQSSREVALGTPRIGATERGFLGGSMRMATGTGEGSSHRRL
ncbi:hypothetical protein LY76DRAFT_41859 [Colletotrichum caudatum]|nr:hypothetical protein LY76DRAFT_41859 [Colletotrichum caudatum]